jgi:hypothetical protein
MPPLAAQNILWGEQFFFCAEAQKKNCSPHKILSAAKPPFIHAKIVKEAIKVFINKKRIKANSTTFILFYGTYLLCFLNHL